MSPHYIELHTKKADQLCPNCKSSAESFEPSEGCHDVHEKSSRIPDGFLVEHIIEFLERYPSSIAPQRPLLEFSRSVLTPA